MQYVSVLVHFLWSRDVKLCSHRRSRHQIVELMLAMPVNIETIGNLYSSFEQDTSMDDSNISSQQTLGCHKRVQNSW